MRKIILIVWTISLFSCSHFITTKTTSSKIDRQSLVTRHRVTLNGPDTLGSLSVGNGEFAFTVDVSGLQTFSKEYENGISLGTQTQWGWHMYPLEKNFTLSDVASLYESCDGVKTPYAIQHGEGPGKEATEALRANPHRLHLGLIGLVLLKEDGSEVKLEDLKAIHQQLDLWTGKIETHYEVEGTPVKVILYGHQQADGIAAKIESPLIEKQRLRIKIDFPYAAGIHTCPGYDWNNPEKHKSVIISQGSEEALIKRTLDQTAYFAHISWTGEGKLSNSRVHHYDLQPSKNNQSFEFAIQFQQDSLDIHKIDFKSTAQSSIQGWKRFWTTGGVVDFSACTDLRAHELERRVVLSQYLTKIQCSGSMPPQETGLTMNSWFGKFHLEMHWWHAAHFALWGRDTLLTKSMEWYKKVLPKAEATARWQGYKGARWQKMTDPSGNESPSSVGAFIIWQQPHPIYMAELLYRNNPTPEILNAYKDLVFRTADFMTSFLKSSNGKYHLCHPIIPAQEIFDATRTDDPTFELQYWYFGIQTAQKWRKRLGMDENVVWKEMLNDLAPLTITNNLYAPCAEPVFSDSYRRDHPAVLGAYGFLPYNDRVDTVIMNKTFEDIANNWQWNATWGWDYPLMAMTATRLNKPEQALDFLLKDVQKNTYLINGHNYQDKRLRLYLPGNGGLLAAIAMMTAGWDGNKRINPGFPKNGAWNVRWEGIKPTP